MGKLLGFSARECVAPRTLRVQARRDKCVVPGLSACEHVGLGLSAHRQERFLDLARAGLLAQTVEFQPCPKQFIHFVNNFENIFKLLVQAIEAIENTLKQLR